MKCLIFFLAITAAPLVRGQCDTQCADDLEQWNVDGTRSCDKVEEKNVEIFTCQTNLGLPDGPSTCTDLQKSRVNNILAAVQNYFNEDCADQGPDEPKEPECDSQEKIDMVNEELIKCKPKDLTGLSLNNILSRDNICLRIQYLVDCTEKPVGICKDELESIISQNLVSYQLIGEMFECDTKVFGRPVQRKLQECKFMELAKCFNPLLKTFGKDEITDNFDLNMINGELIGDLLGPHTPANQATHCQKVDSFDWDALRICVNRHEGKCPYMSGLESYSLASVTVDPRAIVTDLRSLYQILSPLTKIETYCSTECANFATKLPKITNCLTSLSSLASGGNNCPTVNVAMNCAKAEAGTCSLLKDEIALAIGFVPNGASHVTKCGDTITSPANFCSPRAQDQAYVKVKKCQFKYVITEFLPNNVCSRAQAVAWCLESAVGNCPPVANFVNKRYAFFFGFINYNFGCSVTLRKDGLAYTAVGSCDYGNVLNCYQPLLTKYGATLRNNKLELDEFKKLLFGPLHDNTYFKKNHCSKLNNLDWAALKKCDESCSFPSFTLAPQEMYTPSQDLYSWDSGVLLDIEGLMGGYEAVCADGCASVTAFASAFQDFEACNTVGTDAKSTRLPNQIFYNHFLQRCEDQRKNCQERSEFESCLNDKAGSCPYLQDLVDDFYLETTSLAGAASKCEEVTSCTPFASSPRPGDPTSIIPPETTSSENPPPDTADGVAIYNQPPEVLLGLGGLVLALLTK